MSSHQISYNTHIEKLRCSEYPQLSKTTYLDHAGTTLYARSLIDAYHQDLTTNLYGNPHSVSPASDLSTKTVDQARLAVLKYFQASPDHFDVVFTANASAAIKLVADCFREQDFRYIYHKDVHTSIVGVRELSNSPSQCLASNKEVEDWINTQASTSPKSQLQLFAYPAQSNLNGYRPPYSWCRSIRDACRSPNSAQSTFVLLDAASYLTSGRLNMSSVNDAPDFTALSFYKIFGFPDLGALLVKKSASGVMTHRRYFGGGTVDTVTVLGGAFHGSKQEHLHDFLEDGTLPFHNILALTHAIAIHEKIYGSAEDITQHTAYVTAWLHIELKTLKHSNGMPVMDIYQDPLSVYGDPSTQGPVIAFNVLKSDGTLIGKSHLERLAIDCGFQLRTGGVCNPGGIASMLQLHHWELMRNYTEGVRCGGDVDIVGAKPTGICRVSLGPMSTISDVVRFANFIKFFFVEGSDMAPTVRQAALLDTRAAKNVAPIRGCTGYSVSADDFDAHSLWDNQWCIIDSTTGNPVQSRETLRSLTITIDVNSELLRITHASGDDATLSLWEIPNTADSDHDLVDEYSFDLYEKDSVNEWLSSHLGYTCTLARYRHSKLSQTKEATTCVDCHGGATYSSKDQLYHHYLTHAAEFIKSFPFESVPKAGISEKWRQKLWKQSTLPPKRDNLVTRSIPSTTSLPANINNDSSSPKAKLSTLVSIVEVPSVSPKPSRPNTGARQLLILEKQAEKKTRTKDHRFSIIFTRTKGKV